MSIKPLAIVVPAVTLLLGGCATVQNYAVAVNSWQGGSAAQLIHRWGYPSHERKLSNGHRLYIYRFVDRGRTPVIVTPGQTTVTQQGNDTLVQTTPTTYSGGGYYNFHCTTWFEINAARQIVNTSFRGNNCAGTNNFVLTHANPRNMPHLVQSSRDTA